MGWRALLLVSFAAVAGCVSEPPIPGTRAQIETAVARWIVCDECWDHQLRHVVAFGDAAKPLLQEIADNPDSALPVDFEAQMQKLFAMASAVDPALSVNETTFIAIHRTALRDRARARAAVALDLLEPRRGSRDGVRIVQ